MRLFLHDVIAISLLWTVGDCLVDEECVRQHIRNNPMLSVRFSAGQLGEMCRREEEWQARAQSRADTKTVLSDSQSAWLEGLWSCENLQCLCTLDPTSICETVVSPIDEILSRFPSNAPSRRGGKGGSRSRSSKETSRSRGSKESANRSRRKRQFLPKLTRARRQEYRRLSDAERRRFHDALNRLKREEIDGLSKYDLLVLYHTPEQSPGAHFGPALLPFHRELLKQLEMTLRVIDPRIALPYWDSSLDEPLPDARDSILWTEEFFGNADGAVTTGPFASWKTYTDARIDHLSPDRRIVRNAGVSQFAGLYRAEDKRRILAMDSFEALTFCVDPYFELVHGTVHLWVGGHMTELRISPNDPVFFVLHSFVDYLWEDFRQLQQSRFQRENDYPAVNRSCNSFHYKSSQMLPFQLTNGGGLSSSYTDDLYSYEPSPTCSRRSPSCNSEFLFCDTLSNPVRCLSKVKVGGNCTGFEGRDICHRGHCLTGVCKSRAATVPPPPPIAATLPPTTTRRTTISSTTQSTTRRRPSTTASTTRRPTTRAMTPPSAPAATTTPRRTAAPTARTRMTTPSPRITTATAFGELDGDESEETVWIPITVISIRSSLIRPFRSGSIETTERGSDRRLFGRFASTTTLPYYTGAAYAQVGSPFSSGGRTEAQVNVYDELGRPCNALCLQDHQKRPWRYTPCQAHLMLDADPRQSDNVPFTPHLDRAALLGWRGDEKIPDPFLFVCHTRSALSGPRRPPLTTTTTVTPVAVERVVIESSRQSKQTVNIDLKNRQGGSAVTCENSHRCCGVWASVGECSRNRWMRYACAKACFACNTATATARSAAAAGDHCADVHAESDCVRWRLKGECADNADWMEENCARTCAVCGRSSAQLERICGSCDAAASGECRDCSAKCPNWARRGECRRNPWWMRENCASSCHHCEG